MTDAVAFIQLAVVAVGGALVVIGIIALRLLRLCLIALTRMNESSRQQTKKVGTLLDEIQRMRRGR